MFGRHAMTRFRSFGLISVVAFGLIGPGSWPCEVSAAGAAKTPTANVTKPPPASVKDAIRLTPEGLRLGMALNEGLDFYNKILDQDYVPIYKMTPIAPKMKEAYAPLAAQKLAFTPSQ